MNQENPKPAEETPTVDTSAPEKPTETENPPTPIEAKKIETEEPVKENGIYHIISFWRSEIKRVYIKTYEI